MLYGGDEVHSPVEESGEPAGSRGDLEHARGGQRESEPSPVSQIPREEVLPREGASRSVGVLWVCS